MTKRPERGSLIVLGRKALTGLSLCICSDGPGIELDAFRKKRPTLKRHVIIGNSGAAISAVQGIRAISSTDAITVISKEDCSAYSPVLTTYYLAGSILYKDMFLFRDEELYGKNNVKAILGKEAIKVNTDANTVLLEDGALVEYDDLLIATGASPQRPKVTGTDLPKIYTLRTLQDAERIAEASKKAQDVLIIGGGLVGLQVANALFGKGAKMTLMVASQQILSQNVDGEAAKIIQKRVESFGVRFLLGRDVESIKEKGDKVVVTTNRGEELPADMLVVAKGVTPNIKLVEGSGVKLARGILVDKWMRTNIENVYAAGDVAGGIDDITGRPRSNPTWPSATGQGWVAGMNMAGQKVPFLRNVQFNICTLFGLSFASVGLTKGEGKRYNEVACRMGSNYRKFIFEGNVLVGAVLVGEVDDTGILTNFIERRRPCPELREELQRNKAFVPYAKVFSR